jgi:hypothetical protein
MTSTPVAGNLLVAYALTDMASARILNTAAANQGSPSSFTLSAGNGATNTAYVRMGWLIAPSGLSGTYTVTFTFSGAVTGEVCVEEWSVDAGWQATPNGNTNATGAGTGDPNTGAVTTSADSIVIAAVVDTSGAATATFTSTGTGFANTNTQLNGSVFMAGATASRPGTGSSSTLASGTSCTETWTVDGTPQWRTIIQEFKANAAGSAATSYMPSSPTKKWLPFLVR